MIADFITAVTFLTRVRMGGRGMRSTEQIGRTTRWFPLVGLLLGAIYVINALVLRPILPPVLIGLTVVMLEVVITGALHLDGLADMADGFGGGHTPADTIRIMRDHAVGVYGALALILSIGFKTAAIAHLVDRHGATLYILVAPAVGRWACVVMSAMQPYSPVGRKSSTAVVDHVGWCEVTVATVITAIPAAALLGLPVVGVGVAAAAITLAVSTYSHKRIGGVTGDILGANVQVIEVVVLLTGVALTR